MLQQGNVNEQKINQFFILNKMNPEADFIINYDDHLEDVVDSIREVLERDHGLTIEYVEGEHDGYEELNIVKLES